MDTNFALIALPIAFLAFGALVVGLEIRVLTTRNQGFGPQAVRIVGVTIVIVVACAIAASGLKLEVITGVIGLLGTLGGYLAGKPDTKPE
jgi:hypothetical protein